jgi:hypothetical protein
MFEGFSLDPACADPRADRAGPTRRPAASSIAIDLRDRAMLIA